MDENIVCVILNLGWNGIGVQGGSAWGKQLEHNASLKVADLALSVLIYSISKSCVSGS